MTASFAPPCNGPSKVPMAEAITVNGSARVEVTASTLADPFTVIASAIGTLEGPLHGGANEAVIHMLEEIATIEAIPAFLDHKFSLKQKIMGFGHRIYKVKDPRANVLQE